MPTLLRQLLEDDSGQDLIEYSLIASFIALAATTMIINLGTGVNSVYTTSNTEVQSAATAVTSGS